MADGKAHKSREYVLALREVNKKSPNYQKAIDLLQKAWANKDPYAAYALGTWYLHGHIFVKNTKKAVRFLRAASKGGVADANFDLAICLEKGEGTDKNPNAAFLLY